MHLFKQFTSVALAVTLIVVVSVAHAAVQFEAKPALPVPPKTSVVAHWSFDASDTTTTNISDVSGNGHDGTPNNYAAGGSPPTSTTYTSDTTFTVPSGVSQVTVEAWGAGSGGNSSSLTPKGGGGGAYAASTLSVSPGQNHTIDIGAGGGNGVNGAATVFGNNLVVAAGGTSTTGAGGTVAASTGTTRYAGGDGGDYSLIGIAGGGGGSAGPSGNGVNGENASIIGNGAGGAGNNGNGGAGGASNSDGGADATGGGGGGGGGSGGAPGGGAGGSSGSGANGQIILTYAVGGNDYQSVSSEYNEGGPFDGGDEFIDVGNLGATVKSVSFWLQADDRTDRGILDLNGSAGIRIDGSRNIVATGWSSPTIYVNGSAGNNIPNNSNWHHVVVTSNTGINANNVDIGRFQGNYFDGILDEVVFYSTALSSGDVSKLATPDNGGNTDKVGHWTFNEPADVSGSTANDISGNANHGSGINYFGGGSNQIQTFTSDTTFTVPSGVSQVTVEAWGGGADGIGGGGNGGGGGAYASSTLSVSPGQDYTVDVGAGGSSGGNGAASIFGSNLVVAAGGSSAGDGGSVAASTGSTRHAGGDGGDNYYLFLTYCGGGGGSAGPDGAGQAGGNAGVFHANGGDGNNGNGGAGGAGDAGGDDSTGGGGGGGQYDGGAPGGGAGGCGDAGGDGQIVLSYEINGTDLETTAGPFEEAATFNGSNQYVDIGATGQTARTISLWLKADDRTNRGVLDLNGTQGIKIDPYYNILAVGFNSPTIYVNGAIGSVIPNTTGWHHVAITDELGASASNVDIGRFQGSYFDGAIDDVRFYSRAFTAQEVAGLETSKTPYAIATPTPLPTPAPTPPTGRSVTIDEALLRWLTAP